MFIPGIESNPVRLKLPYRGLALIILALALVPAQAMAQRCGWGGTSTVPAPEFTFLRAVNEDLRAPTRLATDSNGNIYIADPGSGKMVQKNRFGLTDLVIPGLGTPSAIAVDASGFVFIADADSGSVNVYDSSWALLFQLGRGNGEFTNPNDIAIDPDTATNTIYVSDGAENLVKVYDLNGAWKFNFDGSSGPDTLSFNFPSAVHVSGAGQVIVGDQNNDRVQVFDRQGVFQYCFGSKYGPGSFKLRFGRILGITTDSLDRIYVADGFQGEVQVFDANGIPLATIGGFGSEPGQLRTPMGLSLDRFNRLWIASVNNSRAEVFGIDTYQDPVYIPPQDDDSDDDSDGSSDDNDSSDHNSGHGSDDNSEDSSNDQSNDDSDDDSDDDSGSPQDTGSGNRPPSDSGSDSGSGSGSGSGSDSEDDLDPDSSTGHDSDHGSGSGSDTGPDRGSDSGTDAGSGYGSDSDDDSEDDSDDDSN